MGVSKKHGGAALGPTRAKQAWAELGVDGLGLADQAPAASADPALRPRLTCEMVTRLQGWRDEWGWRFSGLKTARYRQIGNAFPPPVAEAVGGAIRRALEHADASGLADSGGGPVAGSAAVPIPGPLPGPILGPILGDQDHLERARAMDALDPVQLDVAGGGRAADPGERAGGVQPGQRLGDQADDLLGPDDA